MSESLSTLARPYAKAEFDLARDSGDFDSLVGAIEIDGLAKLTGHEAGGGVGALQGSVSSGGRTVEEIAVEGPVADEAVRKVRMGGGKGQESEGDEGGKKTRGGHGVRWIQGGGFDKHRVVLGKHKKEAVSFLSSGLAGSGAGSGAGLRNIKRRNGLAPGISDWLPDRRYVNNS